MKKKNTFSNQIRKAIKDSGASQYAIAKRIGVAGSILSRFMAKKQSLTLDTLDRLADVLGLEIVVSVQNLPRPTKAGRKAGKGKTMLTVQRKTSLELADVAKVLANDAFANHFESRRGVWHMEDLGVTCLYNNNPYAADEKRRDRETEAFRRKCKAEGIKELAYATTDNGYTYAMLLDCDESRMEWITQTMSDIIKTEAAAANPKK